jgi:hypothetical protein
MHHAPADTYPLHAWYTLTRGGAGQGPHVAFGGRDVRVPHEPGEFVDIATVCQIESNWSQRRKGEGPSFFLLAPEEESLHGAFVATDSASGAIIGLQFIKPAR